MKKLLLIVVVLLMAAPLYAENEIRFSFVDNWDGSCTITYDVNEVAADPCDDPPVRPVAMGLTVDVISGAPIKEVILEDNDPCGFFEIFMDAAYSMELDPCDPCGYCYGCGTAIADPCGPGEILLPQTKFSISMGGLGGETDPDQKSPPTSGTITLYADAGATETTGTIELDAMRGGIIGNDGEPMVVIGLDNGPAKNGKKQWKLNECYRESDAVPNWYDVGKPVCWCYARQCRGDSDGNFVGNPMTGYHYVGIIDIGVLAAAWKVMEPAKGPGIQSIIHNGIPGACADHAHNKVGNPITGYHYVGIDDIGILAGNWKIKEPVKGPGVPVCVWTGGTVEIDPRTEQPGSGPTPP